MSEEVSPVRVVYSGEEIFMAAGRLAGGIEELAGELPLTLLILLKGGVRLGCDILSSLEREANYDFIGVSSYGDKLSSSGRVEYYHYRIDPAMMDNRAVVLIDDICDSGTTLTEVTRRLNGDFSPAKLITCTLIVREGAGFEPDLHGFRYRGDEFLVGYGLGAGERYRGLNAIMALCA